MVTVAVHGARGYLGRELVRLLVNHPHVASIAPVSQTEAGQPYHAHVPGFRSADLRFVAPDDATVHDADVAFLAVPGGTAAALVASHEAAGAKTVIDLSRDHRNAAIAGDDGWSYGLADLWPVAKGTKRIANPGCYPTASLLAIAPALQHGLVADGPLIVDGKSGVSGAGVGIRDDLHYPAMNESVRAYKVLGHDHTHEIAGAAGRLAGKATKVRFTPHLVPQTRGLLATVYATVVDGVTPQQAKAAYESDYSNHPSIDFLPEADTAHLRGSNRAEVAVDVDTDTGILVARGAIDNIQKGGAGTAVQNMNDSIGFDSYTGLLHIGGNL